MAKKSGEKTEKDSQVHCSKQTTITASFSSVTAYERSSRRHCEITTAITHYIAKDMVPVNTVTKDGLKNLHSCTRSLEKKW